MTRLLSIHQLSVEFKWSKFWCKKQEVKSSLQPPAPAMWPASSAERKQDVLTEKKKQQKKTHLYHLLYVLFDDGRVGAGLHWHGPVIDHGGLGVRHRGGARVLLWSRRKVKPKDVNKTAGETLMLRFYKGNKRLLRVKMLWEHNDFLYVLNAAAN